MESSAPSASEKQGLISSFLEIAVGQSAETALQFLQATNWKLEEAIQLFYLGNEAGGSTSSSILPPADERPMESVAASENVGEVGNDEVRAPLPVKRETLYGDASFVRLQPSSVIAFRNFEEESKQPAVWESEQTDVSTTNGNGPRDNLASLYRPPFALMYQGTFDKVMEFTSSIADIDATIEPLDEEEAECQQAIAKADAEVAKLQAEIARLQNSVEPKRQRLEEIAQSRQMISDQLEDLERQKEAVLAQRKAEMDSHAVAMQQLAPDSRREVAKQRILATKIERAAALKRMILDLSTPPAE